MKVINKNAAGALFETLENLSQRPHESWRCIYLKPFSHRGSMMDAKTITDLLAKIDGTIYLCDDGDILILFQRSLKLIIDKVSKHLGDFGSDEHKDLHTYNLFGVFDLGKHWQNFYSICERKYLKAIALSEQKRIETLAGSNLSIAPIAHDLRVAAN